MDACLSLSPHSINDSLHRLEFQIGPAILIGRYRIRCDSEDELVPLMTFTSAISWGKLLILVPKMGCGYHQQSLVIRIWSYSNSIHSHLTNFSLCSGFIRDMPPVSKERSRNEIRDLEL